MWRSSTRKVPSFSVQHSGQSRSITSNYCRSLNPRSWIRIPGLSPLEAGAGLSRSRRSRSSPIRRQFDQSETRIPSWRPNTYNVSFELSFCLSLLLSLCCYCVVIISFPIGRHFNQSEKIIPSWRERSPGVWAANVTPQSVITKTLLEAQRTHGVETINGVTSICGATCIMFCQLEVLQIWSPGGATCIVVLLGNALATSSTSIELVSSSAEVTSVKS